MMVNFKELKNAIQEKQFIYDTIIGALNRISVSDDEEEVSKHIQNITENLLPQYALSARKAHCLTTEFNSQLRGNQNE